MDQEAADHPNRTCDETVESPTPEAPLDDEKSIKTSPTQKLSLVYKVQYRNELFDEIVYTRDSEGPIVVDIKARPPEQLPALELITDVYTNATLQNDEQLKEPPQSVYRVDSAVLKINSPAIINALQKVVDYYPDQDFSEDSLSIPEPFALLIHHQSELASFRETCAPDKLRSEPELCEREENTYEHLGVLQKFLEQRVGDSTRTESLRHEKGFATFDMLWMLLKPGTTVYTDTYADGNYDAYVIHSVNGGAAASPTSPLRITMWYLEFDGRQLGRRSFVKYQSPYNGEKSISALQVFPCEFWEDKPTERYPKDLKESLIERGKTFLKLTSRRCMYYDGLTSSTPRKHYKSLVIVDSETMFDKDHTDRKPTLKDLADNVPQGVSQCLCTICLKYNRIADTRKTSRFSGYDEIYVEKTKELTEHQYLLCSESVYAYVLKTRSWQHLLVACFSEPLFDRGMIDTLVMADERRRMIKALAENYQQKLDHNPASAHRPWAADYVEGKGQGKIFLLHGRPGVGKTYTAECIAQFTQRPLISLTTSDIGTDPAQAETNLNFHFARAKLWNAILLIDEADIFMERREAQDLTRNSLVSSFLRATENCQSILFLTTNRVGTFDDAFISRIHVALYYPDLSEDDRKKVWRNFFEKLIKDRGDIMRVPIDTKDYTNGQEVRALKWNGREIRNAFQTAVALADFEGAKDEEGKILLKDTHIMQIVRISKEFKTYLHELHQGDESKRAERQRMRYDDYEAQSGDSDGRRRKI